MARVAYEPPGEPLNALELLTRDHRLVDGLFASIAQAAPQQVDPLARRLCKLLRIHSQIEEDLFYPVASRALGENERLGAASHAHREIKDWVMRIESKTSSDADFRESLDTLQKIVTAHFATEETELFPPVRRSKVDLTALGLAMAERRDSLMDVLGLHGDDEEGAQFMREAQRDTRAAAANDDSPEQRPQ
jgi:hemerythrin superfamily protein